MPVWSLARAHPSPSFPSLWSLMTSGGTGPPLAATALHDTCAGRPSWAAAFPQTGLTYESSAFFFGSFRVLRSCDPPAGRLRVPRAFCPPELGWGPSSGRGEASAHTACVTGMWG